MAAFVLARTVGLAAAQAVKKRSRAAAVALAYLDRPLAEPGTALEVHLLGIRRPATVIAPSPVDPTGTRMRA